MKVEDLIPNTFYWCSYIHGYCEYFLYKGIKNTDIISNGYHISEEDKVFKYHLDKDSVFSGISYLECCTIRKISIEEIIDYLPESNVDKKHYLRRKKINSLI